MKIISKIFVLLVVTCSVLSIGCRGGLNGTCGQCGALNYPSQYNYSAPPANYVPPQNGAVIQQPGFQTVQPGFQQVPPGQ